MNKVLEDAVEKLKELPDDRQRYIACIIDELIDADGAILSLSADERLLVREGLADLDAGRIGADADMDAFWNRHRS